MAEQFVESRLQRILFASVRFRLYSADALVTGGGFEADWSKALH
jgi:hypothetical protein